MTVNGEPRPLAAGTTIRSLLAELAIEPRLVVVEHNRQIVRDRSTWEDRAVESGGVVEIVHFVGGG